MSQHWDEFSKSLAEESFPRRESLRRLGTVIAGALFGSMGLKSAVGAPKTDPCTAFCKCSNKRQQSHCLAACRECNNDPRWLCGNCANGYACTDFVNDPDNCGACFNDCGEAGPYEYAACVDGGCEYDCVSGADRCNGTCTDLAWDSDNCGACGNVCDEWTPVCDRGTCIACPDGWTDCGGGCTDLQWDEQNCGACGSVCIAGTTCQNSTCQPNNCVPNCPTNWCGGDGCGGTCGCPANSFCMGDGLNMCVPDCPPGTDYLFDALNCGACGHSCQQHEFCSFGVCDSSGGGDYGYGY